MWADVCRVPCAEHGLSCRDLVAVSWASHAGTPVRVQLEVLKKLKDDRTRANKPFTIDLFLDVRRCNGPEAMDLVSLRSPRLQVTKTHANRSCATRKYSDLDRCTPKPSRSSCRATAEAQCALPIALETHTGALIPRSPLRASAGPDST